MSEARILTEEECRDIYERVKAFARGGGETGVFINSWWQGELRWGRNRVSLSSERRDVRIKVIRVLEGVRGGEAVTNQLDDATLEAAVRAAERRSWQPTRELQLSDFEEPHPSYTMPESAPIWSSATAEASTGARGEVARSMIEPAEAAGLYSAGYLEVRAAASVRHGTWFPDMPPGEYTIFRVGNGNPQVTRPYTRWTQTQCSTTVRDASGTGSGWAGLSSYDWDRVHSETGAMGKRAVQKCLASRNPVALEPGRYTVILEPQAVVELMYGFVHPAYGPLVRRGAEHGGTFSLAYDDALGLWYSKVGMKVVDERITIEHDPMDPRLGIRMNPTNRPGPVTFIERGVLKNLSYGAAYAIWNLKDGRYGIRSPWVFRMSGGDTSIEEMIRTTRRGLLVTRFSDIEVLDWTSLLTTGHTRDGLWLIENGEITKSVKNFRFTESPLFMLNNVEQIGEAVPVFRPSKNESGGLMPAVVPAIKARDFSFTSLIDAV